MPAKRLTIRPILLLVIQSKHFFGVLKRRFPCLRNGLRLKLDTTVKVIVACGVLHNISKEQDDDIENYFEEIEDKEKDNFIFNEPNLHCYCKLCTAKCINCNSIC
jgi:hypothetical protein